MDVALGDVGRKAKGRIPVLNPAYAALADHYGTVIEPARPNHPQDKPLAEISVKLVHRALTAILRRRSFFSLRELNEAVKEVVEKLNSRRFTLVPTQSRASLFELIDRPALLPLPQTSFAYEAMQVGLLVGADYHVPFEGSSYSVPYHLIGDRVDLRIARNAVEVWRQGHPAVADAILDRLVHSSHRLSLTGESMRKLTAAPIE